MARSITRKLGTEPLPLKFREWLPEDRRMPEFCGALADESGDLQLIGKILAKKN